MYRILHSPRLTVEYANSLVAPVAHLQVKFTVSVAKEQVEQELKAPPLFPYQVSTQFETLLMLLSVDDALYRV